MNYGNALIYLLTSIEIVAGVAYLVQGDRPRAALWVLYGVASVVTTWIE